QQALKRPDLEKYAQELGLDMAKFKQALDSGTYKGRLSGDQMVGNQVGVTGTPAFFINGRLLEGAYPYEAFKKIVDEELVTAHALLARGRRRRGFTTPCWRWARRSRPLRPHSPRRPRRRGPVAPTSRTTSTRSR